jgi:hypothetical protein
MSAFVPELDILVWAPRAERASQISNQARKIFAAAGRQNLHLAVASFPRPLLEPAFDITWDQDHIACLRSCLMKSEHLEWTERIWEILDQVMQSELGP